jgi:hypothetical protein
MKNSKRTRAQISTTAIERIYITMRHLFIRGFYKPMGVSGQALINELLILQPEIYGSMGDEVAELEGLLYIIDRLPEGIAECRFIHLTADEGLAHSNFTKIIPAKRRRNCYRIDRDQVNIEITRGRSDVYDILTHLTFMFIEADKIARKVMVDDDGGIIREWKYLEEVVLNNTHLEGKDREVLVAHLSSILGRTFEETLKADMSFATAEKPDRLFEVIYWMGKLALNEIVEDKKHEITFSSILRDRIGHHSYGDTWAQNIKRELFEKGLHDRPINIISANMHSVMNSIYGPMLLPDEAGKHQGIELFEVLGESSNKELRKKIKKGARSHGLTFIKDSTGANIDVQIIDTQRIDFGRTRFVTDKKGKEMPVIIVMDYAFGEQAYETLDELLKPFKKESKEKVHLNVESVSVMGKAGILEGDKGDIMIPNAHIFEGTADNYPFENELSASDLEGHGIKVFEGSMITVLGTSLQNKDLLEFFHKSTWGVIGLEMEGAHYQKAIQSASRIRGNIGPDVKVRYAYYASDNPLKTGSTLASGGLGSTGIRPTYIITRKILEQIF